MSRLPKWDDETLPPYTRCVYDAAHTSQVQSAGVQPKAFAEPEAMAKLGVHPILAARRPAKRLARPRARLTFTGKNMSVVAIRQWRDADLEPFAALNADLDVMRHFPSPLTREQSDALAERQRTLIASRGWGLWAVEVDGAFAGFTGLAVPSFEAPFMPCVEIGWRIARNFWGQSVAYRAALLALSYGFDTLKLAEIVSFTAAVNSRSTRLMERLGFARDQHGDFFHPRIDRGHELSRHVLYRKRPNQSPEPTALRLP